MTITAWAPTIILERDTAAWRPHLLKGEAAGHEFRGNQWVEGESGPEHPNLATSHDDAIARLHTVEQPKLSASNRGWLDRYTGEEYGELNDALRTSDKEAEWELGNGKMQSAEQMTAKLDPIVNCGRTTEPMTVVRVIHDDDFHPTTNGTYTDSAFISTSADPDIINDVYLKQGSTWDAYIDLPVGTIGVSVPDAISVTTESEFILPRDSMFHVDSIDESARVAHLTWIGVASTSTFTVPNDKPVTRK